MAPIVRNTVFALAIAATPAFAWAEDAFTMQQTDLFAGPSSEFPQVASLPANTEVGVAGCLSDWSWCDVSFSNQRGWVWAGDLGYPYEGRRVAIIEYGPRLRLPAVTFSINTYWDEHYRSRPFYRERNVWVSRVHVEGGHGGRPPHGGTRVATPSQGQQPQAQGAQRPPEAAQRQGDERARQEAAKREGDQRAHEEAAQKSQAEQRNRQEAQRAQPNTPQANAARRPEEAMGSREGRQQPEASRGQQAEQRAQSMDQRAQAADQHRAQPEQGRGNTAQERSAQQRENQSSASPESMRAQPDRGANAKGPQNEASRGQPDRGANAKGPQGERPKDEGKEQQ